MVACPVWAHCDVTAARRLADSPAGRRVQPKAAPQVYFFVFSDLFNNGTTKNEISSQNVIFTCKCFESNKKTNLVK